METTDEQKRIATAQAMAAIEGKYFLRYAVVVLIALVAFTIYWAFNRQKGG